MSPSRQWLAGLGLVVVLGGVAAFSLIPSEIELAEKASARLEAALGVPVHVGALHWRVLPRPMVVFEDVSSVQSEPVLIKKLSLYPALATLWRLDLQLELAELEGAVIPQKSLSALGKASAKATAADDSGPQDEIFGGFALADVPLVRLVFKDLSWVSRTGISVVYEGEVDFDPGWRPGLAQLRRPGFKPLTDLTLTRKSPQETGNDKGKDSWAALVNLGGGTAHGQLQLSTQADGRLQLSGKLKPRDIEVSSALQAFNRRPVLAGKLAGDTTLSARGDSVGELARSLHTTTVFNIGKSTLLRFDLGKAVRSLGKDHEGQTGLDSITGQLDTQNTADGMVMNFTRIQARSGLLSASGQARLHNRNIDAELAVDLVDGIVGVPLKLSGPVSKVRVSVPAGAVVGAAAGTAVLPGVGTAIGARLGAALGKLFGKSPGSAGASPQPER
ncbi:MAG: hypothetical protein V4772_16085 [Pseudomonadota bacterium]